MSVIIACTLLAYYNFSPAFFLVPGFHSVCSMRTAFPSSKHHDRSGKNGGNWPYLFATTSDDSTDDFIDVSLINAASKKLDWEISVDRSQKPVLNLSLRDASPEDLNINTDDADSNSSLWNQGQHWEITEEYLSELGALSSAELSSPKTISSLLENCPQLFRLDPDAIKETAQWIIDEFGLPYLQGALIRDNNPVLLTYRKDDAVYGLKFMSMMMMMDAKPACAASSALLEAIRGGIQERTISAALGAAGSATTKASRSIASDTMESFRQLRDANRNKN